MDAFAEFAMRGLNLLGSLFLLVIGLVVLSAAIGGASGYGGAVASALLPRKPAGAVIVLTAGALFAVSMLLAPRRGVLASAARRLRLRLNIGSDHLLEAAYLGYKRADGGLTAAAFGRTVGERGWGALYRLGVRLQLRRRGLGRFVAGRFLPTPAGLERGRRVARNHRLWEQYLITHADVAPGHVDWTVDQVEHVLAPELIRELEALLGRRGVPTHALGSGAVAGDSDGGVNA